MTDPPTKRRKTAESAPPKFDKKRSPNSTRNKRLKAAEPKSNYHRLTPKELEQRRTKGGKE